MRFLRLKKIIIWLIIENIYKQIKRRFDLIIHIDENKIDLFVFNEKNNFKEKVLLKSFDFGFKEINNLKEDIEHEIYKTHFNEMKNSLFIDEVLKILKLK